jgi:hypothetical protein
MFPNGKDLIRTLRIRYRKNFKKVSVPQFKHQQTPDPRGVVAAFREVFVQQAPYALRIEIPALQGARLKHYGKYQIFQFMPNPMNQW